MYNWVVNFLTNRCHHTKVSNLLSILAFINASIVQGSGLGPCSFVLDASDLHPQDLINLLFKYADDIDLVVPASHTHTIQLELDAILRWASDNNLELNVTKSCEMIVRRPRFAADDPAIPPPVSGLVRVTSLKTLGVTFSDRLDFLSISELSAPGPRGLCTPSESSGHTVSRERIYGRFVRQLL